ncbi:MAG: YihY/virulence factor BrkB family protein [Proteobacteria bacterium]|nr:YihY/virulence factor BrkB family protein [Pseudomonadota bacterium]
MAALRATLWDTCIRFVENEAPQRAGAIAFSTLLSLFPFVLFLGWLAGLLATVESVKRFLFYSFDLLPSDVDRTLRPAIEQVLEGRRGGVVTLSVVVALWAASAAVEAFRSAFNRAYGVSKPRPFWFRRLQGLLFVVGGAVATILIIWAGIVWPILIAVLPDFLTSADRYFAAVVVLPHIFALFTTFVASAAFYHWLPNVSQRWRDVVPGAMLAAVLWLALAALFSWYLKQATFYAVAYGSLAGIIITLVFFYFSAGILIFGAEFNGVLRERRMAQSKEGILCYESIN